MFPPGPDGGQGQKIGKIQGVDHGPPDIGVPIAGMGSEPGFKDIDRLDPAAKTQRAENAPKGSGPFFKLFEVVMQKDDI